MEEYENIKRTPEIEDYLVCQAIAMTTLGNTLLEELPKELYKMEEVKAISKKDLKYIIAQVVLQYDGQFGINALGKDPVMAKKIYQKLKQMEEDGTLEVIDKKGKK